jgi:hypothetical protein
MNVLGYGWDILTPNGLEIIKAAVAGSGMLLLLWRIYLEKTGRKDHLRKTRNGILIFISLLACMLWGGKLIFNFKHYLHLHDMYHYYMGVKYFKELGYTGLYECAAVADIEDGYEGLVHMRGRHNIRTNQFESAQPIFNNPDKYKQGFSAERWALFKRDIAYFRTLAFVRLDSQHGGHQWSRMNLDHGFNATPTWCLAGVFINGETSVSNKQIANITIIDFIIVLLIWLVAYRCFGWEVTLVAMIYWGTNLPAEFAWTSASFLRYGWLLFLVFGICMLKCKHPTLAGASIACSALLRIFPGFIIIGLLLKEIIEMISKRKMSISPTFTRFSIGCLAMIIFMIPLSTFTCGRGWNVWTELFENCKAHIAAPIENYMGLKSVIAYTPHDRENEDGNINKFNAFKSSRDNAFDQRKYIFSLMVISFMIMLARSIHGKPYWASAILGIGIIPFSIELTSYYFSMLLVYAFLSGERASIGAALCALACVSRLIPFFFKETNSIYAAASLLTIIFVVFALIDNTKKIPSPESVWSLKPTLS